MVGCLVVCLVGQPVNRPASEPASEPVNQPASEPANPILLQHDGMDGDCRQNVHGAVMSVGKSSSRGC